jgi:hypothetical protein
MYEKSPTAAAACCLLEKNSLLEEREGFRIITLLNCLSKYRFN